jgi:hypothetical protein
MRLTEIDDEAQEGASNPMLGDIDLHSSIATEAMSCAPVELGVSGYLKNTDPHEIDRLFFRALPDGAGLGLIRFRCGCD